MGDLSRTFSSEAAPLLPAFDIGGQQYDNAGLQSGLLSGAAGLLSGGSGGSGGGGLLGGLLGSVKDGSALNFGTALLGGSAQDNNLGIGSVISKGLGSGLGKMLGTTNLSGGVWGAASNLATSGLSKILGKDMSYDDKAGQIMSQVTGGLKMLGPWGLAAGTALDMLNMVGSKYYEGTKTDQVNTSEVASSYNVGNYEMEGQNISGIGRLTGASSKFTKERNEKQRKLNTIADIGIDARTDKLKSQGSLNAITLRNQIDSEGGVQMLRVKNGGMMIDWEFLRKCKQRALAMQNGGTVKVPDMPLDFVERMEVQNGTKGTIGKDSEIQDSQTQKATKNQIDKTQKESSKTSNSLSLGLNNLTNLYGSNVLRAQNGLVIPRNTPFNTDKKKGVVKQSFTGSSTGIVKHKNGGKFNVIPSGALHKERHHIEDVKPGMEHITTKGIPVVLKNKAGEMKQQAEVEREEIIFTKQLTDKLEAMRKAYNECEDIDEANEIARKAGELLADQILFNTKDYSGITKKIKL